MASYTIKLILFFYSLYAFSPNIHASNDADFDFFERLQALNLKTKEEFDKKTNNKKFMTKYLDEAMMLYQTY